MDAALGPVSRACAERLMALAPALRGIVDCGAVEAALWSLLVGSACPDHGMDGRSRAQNLDSSWANALAACGTTVTAHVPAFADIAPVLADLGGRAVVLGAASPANPRDPGGGVLRPSLTPPVELLLAPSRAAARVGVSRFGVFLYVPISREEEFDDLLYNTGRLWSPQVMFPRAVYAEIRRAAELRFRLEVVPVEAMGAVYPPLRGLVRCGDPLAGDAKRTRTSPSDDGISMGGYC